MLRLTARVCSQQIQFLGDGGLLGHVGGDDFVIVVPGPIREEGLKKLCETFDQAKTALFSSADLEAGSFTARDRHGVETQTPIVTLSLSVVSGARLGDDFCPARLSKIAASTKSMAKIHTAKTGKSGYVFEASQSEVKKCEGREQ